MQTSHISALPGAWRTPSAATERGAASAAVSGAASSFGSVRQATLRVIAAQVLGALTQATGGLSGLRAREGDHRGDGSAGAVAQALKAATAQGADPQALLAKVEEGIDSARTALTERGADPAQVAAAAAQFTDSVANLMQTPEAGPVPAVDAFAASVQVARKERGSLMLTTQDGDVLRIRFRTSERQHLELAGVDTGDAQAASAHWSSSARSRTRVDVEGTLDAGELKAIEDFVAKVDTLANEFFEGDVEAAFAAAAALDYDAGEIAGFSLKLSMRESVQASAVQRTTAGGASSAARVAAPAPRIVTDAAATLAEPTQNAAPTSATSDATAATPTTASDPMQTVQDFMQRMLRTADAPLSVGGFKLAWSAKLKLAAEVVTVAAPAGTQKPGTALLSDALDSAAAQAGADAPQTKLAEAA